jgi:cytochrome P450
VIPAEGCPVSGSAGVALVDPQTYVSGNPHELWRELRRTAPVTRHHDAQGREFWSVTTYAESVEVLRNPAVFTSERGTFVDMLGGDDPAGGQQMAVTDPPRHTQMRRPLQEALSLTAFRSRTDHVGTEIARLINTLADAGVHDLAEPLTELPMAVTGLIMGIPRSDWSALTRLTTTCIAPDEPALLHPSGRQHTLNRAHRELFAYFQDLVAEKRDDDSGDLIALLRRMEVDGHRLTGAEMVSNCYSMLLGANVTTPHAPMFALEAMAGTDAYSVWRSRPEVDETAVEESLRWASPVNHAMRYATEATTLGGRAIAAGDAVVVWVTSANFDAAVFDEPHEFQLDRRPNKHLAFGAGPHYCVGHIVARVTLRMFFRALLDRFETVEPAGPSSRLMSTFVSGYSSFPVLTR